MNLQKIKNRTPYAIKAEDSVPNNFRGNIERTDGKLMAYPTNRQKPNLKKVSSVFGNRGLQKAALQSKVKMASPTEVLAKANNLTRQRNALMNQPKQRGGVVDNKALQPDSSAKLPVKPAPRRFSNGVGVGP